MIATTILIPAVAAMIPLTIITARETQRRIQPARLELARKGEAILQRKDVVADVKVDVELMLATAFGMRFICLLLLVLTPFVALQIVVSTRARRDLTSAMRVPRSPEMRSLWAIHTSIMLANHPLLFPATFVWIKLWFTPALWIARALDDEMPKNVDGDSVMRVVEQRMVHAH